MSSEEEFDLLEYLRRQPQPETVEIRVSVTYPDGTVVEKVHRESGTLWNAFYPYVRGAIVRRVAEKVCEELDRKDR